MQIIAQEAFAFPNWGHASIRIAVLDGHADLEHPCFQGANVTLLPGPNSRRESPDESTAHGTHIASVLFGQHGSEVEGLAPNCTGFVIPIFSTEARSVSQLDLARAIELAVEKGAHIINISGGQLTDFGEADVWLHNAIRLCCDRNVLVIAAAGNDGCECLHVPAALPNVLAVGALDRQDHPMDFSNWGEAYRTEGLMAPGEDILGAKPGGGTTRASGTSFATPLASGAAALLLSQQASWGQTPDPLKIRRVLLDSALPCESSGSKKKTKRCLAGKLNLPGAFAALTRSRDMTNKMTTGANAVSPQCACEATDPLHQESKTVAAAEAEPQPAESHDDLAASFSSAAQKVAESLGRGGNQLSVQAASTYGSGGSLAKRFTARSAPGARLSAITPSQSPDEVAAAPGMVYTIAVLGYDFGTEARRDSFKQGMPAIDRATGEPTNSNDPLTTFPANPYDPRQMVKYLVNNPSEARSLIWTLNIDLTPIYVVEPAGPYGAEVYEELRKLLAGEILPELDDGYFERVSIPGLLTERTVKLFSGQAVPVIEPQNKRGIYGWTTKALVDAAVAAAKDLEHQTKNPRPDDTVEDLVREALKDFLSRLYYDLRNLGKTSQERALNFGATNAFQGIQALTDPRVVGMQLDEITVEKSPFCRPDSDCWDVKLKFFDPENNQRAKRIFRYTVDVSDLIPVTMGEPRSWTQAY
jgi:cyanobactin maturation PatA/PatG family protease